MLVLRLDLKSLQHFLQQHSAIVSNIRNNLDNMLRMELIKQSLPFSDLSHERLTELASRVTELKIRMARLFLSKEN